MIHSNTSDTWVRNLAGLVNLEIIDEVSLYQIIDKELNVHHPPLKHLIDLITGLSIVPSESLNDFGVCVEEQMEVGGIGCHNGFTLSWDCFSVALIIKGLSEHQRHPE